MFDLAMKLRRSPNPGSSKWTIVTASFLLVSILSCGISGCEGSPGETSATAQSVTTVGSSDDWPRWGGPARDLISTETEWLTDWAKNPPVQVWESQIGIGFSSMAIVDGRLYTMGYRNGQDHVWCLDASTGEEVWKHAYDAKLYDNLHEGGPGCTPTVANGNVWTLSRDGQLFCLNAQDGSVKWQRNVVEDSGVEPGQWGLTSSPMLSDGRLLLEVGRVMAYDPSTGDVLWRGESYKPGYGSVTPFSWEGRDLVASLNNEKVVVLDVTNGEEVASYDWTSQFDTSGTSPIVADDSIFLSCGYNAGCTLLQLKGNELLRVYKSREMSNHMANCVLTEGVLYGIDGNSHNSRVCRLVCMDYQTGDVKWFERGFGCGTVMLAGDRLLILSDAGELVVAKASSEQFEELGRHTLLDGRCWTVPVLLNGRIFARNAAGRLVCAQLPN